MRVTVKNVEASKKKSAKAISKKIEMTPNVFFQSIESMPRIEFTHEQNQSSSVEILGFVPIDDVRFHNLFFSSNSSIAGLGP